MSNKQWRKESNVIPVVENDQITSPKTKGLLLKLAIDGQPQTTRFNREERLRKSNLQDEVVAVRKIIHPKTGKILTDLLHAMQSDLKGKWKVLSVVTLESAESKRLRNEFERFVSGLPEKLSDSLTNQR
jgi:hypothetical protein